MTVNLGWMRKVAHNNIWTVESISVIHPAFHSMTELACVGYKRIFLYFFKISRWPSKGRCQWHMLSIVQWYTTIDSFWISLLIFIIYSPLHSYSPPTLTPAGFEHRQAGRLTIFPRDHAVGKEQGMPHIRIFSRYPSHRIGERQHTIWIAIKEHTSTWMRLIWCPFILAHCV